MKILTALDKGFSKALTVLIAMMMIALVLIVNIQVFARYIFNFSLGSLSEMPPYIMIFIIWFAAILAVRKSEHVKIELLDLIIKNKKGLDIIRVVIILAMAVAMGVFFYSSIGWVQEAFKYGNLEPALKICYGYLYLIIPFSSFFMTVYYLINFIKGVYSLCSTS